MALRRADTRASACGETGRIIGAQLRWRACDLYPTVGVLTRIRRRVSPRPSRYGAIRGPCRLRRVALVSGLARTSNTGARAGPRPMTAFWTPIRRAACGLTTSPARKAPAEKLPPPSFMT